MTTTTEPTHVITRAILIPGGRSYDIGDQVSSDDVGQQWSYLVRYGYVRSLEQLKNEADAKAAKATSRPRSQTQQSLLDGDEQKPKPRRGKAASTEKETKDVASK